MKDLDAVYRQHAQTVYKFLLSQCRDPQTAEELTQETFYQAVRSIDRFDGSCKVSVWLCQIAKHLWYQHLRKTNRETELPEEAELPLVPSAEEETVSRSGHLDLLRLSAGQLCADVHPGGAGREPGHRKRPDRHPAGDPGDRPHPETGIAGRTAGAETEHPEIREKGLLHIIGAAAPCCIGIICALHPVHRLWSAAAGISGRRCSAGGDGRRQGRWSGRG